MGGSAAPVTVLRALFVVLIALEAAGTATFLVIYTRGSDWRVSPVGRHLAFYSSAVLTLLVLSLLAMVVRSVWMAVPVLAGHVAFAGLVWQRVVLVRRAQRQSTNNR